VTQPISGRHLFGGDCVTLGGATSGDLPPGVRLIVNIVGLIDVLPRGHRAATTL